MYWELAGGSAIVVAVRRVVVVFDRAAMVSDVVRVRPCFSRDDRLGGVRFRSDFWRSIWSSTSGGEYRVLYHWSVVAFFFRPSFTWDYDSFVWVCVLIGVA